MCTLNLCQDTYPVAAAIIKAECAFPVGAGVVVAVDFAQALVVFSSAVGMLHALRVIKALLAASNRAPASIGMRLLGNFVML